MFLVLWVGTIGAVACTVDEITDLAEHGCESRLVQARADVGGEGFVDNYVVGVEELDRRTVPPRYECRVDWSMTADTTERVDTAAGSVVAGALVAGASATAWWAPRPIRARRARNVAIALVVGLMSGFSL